MNTVTLYLNFTKNCAEAIDFYKNAFGATMNFPAMKAPDGRIMHAMMKIGDTNIMMSDSFESGSEKSGSAISMWVYVDDCDLFFERAVKAGCRVTMKMEDQFWGDRIGQVEDPFRFRWTIASARWELNDEEMEKAQKEWMKTIGF